MKPDEERYFLELGMDRRFDYLRNTYGVQPTVHLIFTEDGQRRRMVLATAALLNLIEKLEWGNPDPVVVTRKASATRDIDKLMGEALVRLVGEMLRSAR